MYAKSLKDKLLNVIVRDMPKPMVEFRFKLRKGFSAGVQSLAIYIH